MNLVCVKCYNYCANKSSKYPSLTNTLPYFKIYSRKCYCKNQDPNQKIKFSCEPEETTLEPFYSFTFRKDINNEMVFENHELKFYFVNYFNFIITDKKIIGNYYAGSMENGLKKSIVYLDERYGVKANYYADDELIFFR